MSGKIEQKVIPVTLTVRLAPTRLAKGFGFLFVGEVLARFESQHGQEIITITKEYASQKVAEKSFSLGKYWDDPKCQEPVFLLDWKFVPTS